MNKNKVILTSAITGAATVPTQSKHIPITPEEIANDAIACANAGAAVVHVHARDPKDGRPSSDMKLFGEILERIKAESDVVICTTTGGSFLMTPEERLTVVSTYSPELASCNMGSINFSIHRSARHFQSEDYRFDWEEDYLLNSENVIFPNTFRSIRTFVNTMYAHNTRPEFELYDVGHIYNMAHLIEVGVIKTPIWMQFVMGVLGGIRPTIPDLVHMIDTADRVIGRENYDFSVIGVGYPAEFELGTVAMLMGGHVRVGLEDNLFVRRKQLATNVELVQRFAGIAQEYERELATPDDVREYLELKGIAAVNF